MGGRFVPKAGALCLIGVPDVSNCLLSVVWCEIEECRSWF